MERKNGVKTFTFFSFCGILVWKSIKT